MLPHNTPKFDETTHVLTLPHVTGVEWKIDGETVDAGEQPPLEEGDRIEVEAVIPVGYRVKGDSKWVFERQPEKVDY